MDLRPRTHGFALDSIAFFQNLPRTQEARHLGFQFLRSATAVNANYRAAKRSRSRKEFIAKLGTVVEEADESVEWLELLTESKIIKGSDLVREAKELLAIFAASLSTARENQRRDDAEDP